MKKDYFDEIITISATDLKALALSGAGSIAVNHNQGIAPAIVEINWVCYKAINGYVVGDVVPLKFMGGGQRLGAEAGHPQFAGIWSTSSTSTQIHFSPSSSQITMIAKTPKVAEFNIWGQDTFGWDICIRKEYPNPYGVTFTERALTTTAAMASEVIPERFDAGGRILEFDLVLINNHAGGVSSFKPGEIIYLNQCGGSKQKIDDGGKEKSYDDISQVVYWHNDQKRLRFFTNPPETGNAGLLIRDARLKKTFDIIEDNKSSATNWTYVFRWQYENSLIPYDFDTGWIATNYGYLWPPVSLRSALDIGINKTIKKVDIYNLNYVGAPLLNIQHPTYVKSSIINLSTVKGGGRVFLNTHPATIGYNMFSVSYNDTRFDILTGGVKHNPPYNYADTPSIPLDIVPSSSTRPNAEVFARSYGNAAIRICGYTK